MSKEDKAQAILAPLAIPKEAKARAWDAYYGAADPDAFQKAFEGIPIPREIKANLYDARFGTAPPKAPSPEQERPGFLRSLIPSARDITRGVGAGIGGTVGAPAGPAGIAAGGALGAAGADALYQIIEAMRAAPDQAQSASEVLKGAGGGAVAGVIQEVGGPLVSKGISKAASSSIAKSVERILKPATDSMKEAIESTAMELSQKMPRAWSAKGLKAKLEPQVAAMGRAVEGVYNYIRTQMPGLQIPSDPIHQVIQTAKNAEYIQGKPIPGSEPLIRIYDEMLEFLSRKVPGPAKLAAPATTKQIATGILDASGNPVMRTVPVPARYTPTTMDIPSQLSLDEFRQVKSMWDRAVNYARSSLAREPVREEAFRTGANAIRQLQHQVSPELAVADHQFSIWRDALDSLTKHVRSDVGKETTFDIRQIFGPSTGAAGVLGYYLGGPGSAAELAGAEMGVRVLQKLGQTTGWRTLTMPAKRHIVNLANQGKVQEAVGFFLSQIAVEPLRGGETISVGPLSETTR